MEFSMDNCDEFYIDIFNKPEFKEKLTKDLGDDDAYNALRQYFTSNLNGSIEFTDEMDDCLEGAWNTWRDDPNYVGNSRKMYGADPAAYPPDGSWQAALVEIFGWFYWLEPEGQEYGLFKTEIEAIKFGDRNWAGN